MTRVSVLIGRLRRQILAHRRGLAALSLGLAVALAVQAQAAPPPPTVAVLVAARDLDGGAAVQAGDVTAARFDPARVPRGALRSAKAALGRTTVGPVRAGEPITDVRLLAPAMLEGHPGSVAMPLRIGDAGALELLRVGDRVDILASDPQRAGDAESLAKGVSVLAVPPPRRADVGLVAGGLLVVAVPEATSRRLAGHAVTSYLSVVLVG